MLMTMLSISIYAQIGYQVSLLNSATGEPRANETVSISVAITNSEDKEIFSSTQSATTNDFGVLSLQIGNSTTFDNVDWRLNHRISMEWWLKKNNVNNSSYLFFFLFQVF